MSPENDIFLNSDISVVRQQSRKRSKLTGIDTLASGAVHLCCHPSLSTSNNWNSSAVKHCVCILLSDVWSLVWFWGWCAIQNEGGFPNKGDIRLSLTKNHNLTLLKPAFWQGGHHSVAFIALKQDLHWHSDTGSGIVHWEGLSLNDRVLP